MILHHDICRCLGETQGKVCPKREDCLRYTSRCGSQWVSFSEHLCQTEAFEYQLRLPIKEKKAE